MDCSPSYSDSVATVVSGEKLTRTIFFDRNERPVCIAESVNKGHRVENRFLLLSLFFLCIRCFYFVSIFFLLSRRLLFLVCPCFYFPFSLLSSFVLHSLSSVLFLPLLAFPFFHLYLLFFVCRPFLFLLRSPFGYTSFFYFLSLFFLLYLLFFVFRPFLFFFLILHCLYTLYFYSPRFFSLEDSFFFFATILHTLGVPIFAQGPGTYSPQRC